MDDNSAHKNSNMPTEVDKMTNNDAPPLEETHLESIDSVVQPPVVSPPHKPGRVTSQLQPKAQDYSIFCDLPPEILNHIFAVLQVEDRKSVRLVCRSWYQCSTSLSITKNEKIVFRVNSRKEDIAKVMQKSNFRNLEFQGLAINCGQCLPANIWKVCGHRIRSLKFVECFADDETIRNIIIDCENLISFTWKTNNRRDIFPTPEHLDKLCKKSSNDEYVLFYFNPFTKNIKYCRGIIKDEFEFRKFLFDINFSDITQFSIRRNRQNLSN